jgi:hypothetical protein
MTGKPFSKRNTLSLTIAKIVTLLFLLFLLCQIKICAKYYPTFDVLKFNLDLTPWNVVFYSYLK